MTKFYTDGSGGGPRSACACIQLSEAGKKKICLLLSPCEGPEAELFGGLLGLLMLHAASVQADARWCSDSLQSVETGQKILSKEKEPPSAVWKLWQSFSVEGLSCEWVKSRSGQRENEACDRACNWLKSKGDTLLSRFGEGPVGMDAKRRRSESWTLIDAREFSSLAMRGEDYGDALRILQTKVREAIETNFRINAAM